MPASVQYIDSEDQLKAAATACLGKDVVAIDTEFARFNTYYPIVGLIQVYDGETCYLIDPLSVKDLSALKQLLVAEQVLKVFHACSEDMEVFQQCIGAVPAPVIDSQIAAAALGVGFSMSYQNLVEHYLYMKVVSTRIQTVHIQLMTYYL